MSPEQYCQEKAAPVGSTGYYSLLYVGAEQRRCATAVFAFREEIREITDECRDPGVARLKLQWWREEIERTYRGDAQHPIGKALHEPIRRYDLPPEQLLAIIDGVTMDLDRKTYADFAQLSHYCYRTQSIPLLLAAEVFGYQDRRTATFAHPMGIALRLTDIIRNLRRDAARGQVYLPQEDLVRFAVQPDSLLGHSTPMELRNLLGHMAQRARGHLHESLELLPATDRYRQRASIALGALYQATLDELERDRFRVLEHRLELAPTRKLWIAWRTFRRERHKNRRI